MQVLTSDRKMVSTVISVKRGITFAQISSQILTLLLLLVSSVSKFNVYCEYFLSNMKILIMGVDQQQSDVQGPGSAAGKCLGQQIYYYTFTFLYYTGDGGTYEADIFRRRAGITENPVSSVRDCWC